MTPPTRNRLLLIDGHSMAFRAFFALPVENFATSTGEPTNAVYGFTSMLANLLRDEEPTHVAVAFDVGSVTFRTEMFPDYKGTRDATPEAFKGQVPLLQEVLRALNITILEKPLFEADDIIATLAGQGAAAGMVVLVCSGDRDALQLVTDDVTVLYPRKGVSELTRFTPQEVEEKYGVTPPHYPDLAALVGESSDNIPGVPGVGPKTAAKWIGQYGGLEQILAAADQVPGKAGESLRAHLDQVRLNRRLNAAVTDLELPVTVTDLENRPWDRAALDEVFQALQFGKNLRDRLLAVAPGGREPTAPHSSEVEVTEVGGDDLAAWLAAGGTVALDVVGRGVPGRGDAWRLGLARTVAAAVSVDLTDLGPDGEQALARWLADPTAPKVVHAAKAATHALLGKGFSLAGVVFDTELAAYLRHPDQRGFDLPDVVQRILQRDLAEAADTGQGALDLDLEGDSEAVRSGVRAAAVLELADVLGPELDDLGERGLLDDLELPLVEVLVRMEHTGIAVDEEFLTNLEAEFGRAVDAAAQGAYAAIGREVNLGSPKQLQEVLFDQLDMPKTKKIKTGYTTDAAALADLFARTEHPFLAHLLAHRDVTKLRQTIETLRRSVQDDGRIHTTFQQTVAATGRLSSADPNLQNVPVRTEAGRRIREAFVVGAGFESLMTADYSQIEMRIMAHLSGDEGLIAAFNSGEDLHRYVASRVFTVPAEEVTGEMRSRIKAMSYGLAYGLSAFGLSQQLKIAVPEATALMDDYFSRFGGVRDYLREVVESARSTGYTQTIRGRRRYLPDLTSEHRQRRELAERIALNAPIQGSAADLIKTAMIGVDRRLREEDLGSRMLLQVHDELVLEIAPGERERVEEIVRAEMAGAAELSVPLDVSVGVGRSWHDAAH